MSPLRERTPVWVVRGVIACGVLVGLSGLLLFGVSNPESLLHLDTWIALGFAVGPFALTAKALWDARGSMLAFCLASVPAAVVIWMGAALISDCFGITHRLITGGPLKESWGASFSVGWSLTILAYGYGSAADQHLAGRIHC